MDTKAALLTLLGTLAVACAPTHVPRSGSLAMLERAGDVHVASATGTHGFSAEATVAATDFLAVRAGGQYAAVPSYGAGWAGAGPYLAGGVGRFGLLVEAGGGATLSRSTYTTTIGGTTSTETVVHAGRFVAGGMAVEAGAEWPNGGVGLSTRLVYQRFTHGERSEGSATGHTLTLEPLVVGRGGSEFLKFEAQLGLALPFLLEGDVGVFLPLRMGMGLTWDFPGPGGKLAEPPG